MKSVGVERSVLGAEQVHQAEGHEGGPAEPRLERRRLRRTGQAVQKDSVGQTGALYCWICHGPPVGVRADHKIALF